MMNSPNADIILVVNKLSKFIDIENIMLVGARCRDIHQQKYRDQTAGRRTKDVDFALALESWDDFNLLKQQFSPTGNAWQGITIGNIPVDLVPFGNIENPPGEVLSRKGHLLNVAGFKEVFEQAELYPLNDAIDIKLPTVPGLTALKLHAWLDRKENNIKDASDLALILSWYEEDAETLWNRYFALENQGYIGEPEAMAAELLGLDTGRILGHKETQALLDRFNEQSPPELNQFAESLEAPPEHSHPLERRRIQVEALLGGLRDSLGYDE